MKHKHIFQGRWKGFTCWKCGRKYEDIYNEKGEMLINCKPRKMPTHIKHLGEVSILIGYYEDNASLEFRGTMAVTKRGHFPMKDCSPPTETDMNRYNKSIKRTSISCHHGMHGGYCKKKNCDCYCHKDCDICKTKKAISRHEGVNYCFDCWK